MLPMKRSIQDVNRRDIGYAQVNTCDTPSAARVGMRLDEVPYPTLWLEGLVRSTEGLSSLPSPPSWPDVVSLLSPFSWWVRFWRWWWRRTVSWTWMILCWTGGALYSKIWRGLGVRSCLEILGYVSPTPATRTYPCQHPAEEGGQSTSSIERGDGCKTTPGAIRGRSPPILRQFGGRDQ